MNILGSSLLQVIIYKMKKNFTEGLDVKCTARHGSHLHSQSTSSNERPPRSNPAWSLFYNEAPLANHHSRRAARTEEIAWKRCWTPVQGVNATDLWQRAFNLPAPDLELAESFDSVRVCAPWRVYVRA